MLKNLLAVSCLLLLGTLCSSAQEELNPVKWSLQIEKSSVPVTKGQIFNLRLNAQIEKSWHLYSLEKIDGGPIPTRISLVEEQPYELGKIKAPKPIEINDAAFGVETKFYEEKVSFILPVKVLDNFNQDFAPPQIKVRFQTCNDEICLPPKTIILKAAPDKEQPGL